MVRIPLLDLSPNQPPEEQETSERISGKAFSNWAVARVPAQGVRVVETRSKVRTKEGVYKEKIGCKGNQIMNNWYSVSLGDGIIAAGPSAEIEERFQTSFFAAGKPPEMAVFVRSESEGRLHCEVIAYFSPAAGDVAKAFDAQPCPKPEREGLSLLAGDERSWPVLFLEGAS